MTRPRSLVIDDQREGFYHCVSRCVRRAFLHGVDSQTGKNYEYRKVWVHQRLKFLAQVFWIDVGGYAVMDNHVHMLLRNRPDLSQPASPREVAYRWLLLYPKRRDAKGLPLEPSEKEMNQLLADEARIAELRQRLASISWIMKCLKEYIARKANKEDGCTGRFWEARFKCTALLDEAAVLACLVYVDLNPIRAKVAETPETSFFTSAEERIRKQVVCQGNDRPDTGLRKFELSDTAGQVASEDWLCPLSDQANRRGVLSIDLLCYLEILDWTGRQLVTDKPGVIPKHLPPILTRLSINPRHWLDSAARFGKLFSVVAGTETHMKEAAARMGQKWVRGVRTGKTAFLE